MVNDRTVFSPSMPSSSISSRVQNVVFDPGSKNAYVNTVRLEFFDLTLTGTTANPIRDAPTPLTSLKLSSLLTKPFCPVILLPTSDS